MLVVVVAEAEVQAAEAFEGLIKATLEVDASLLEIENGVSFFLLTLVLFAFMLLVMVFVFVLFFMLVAMTGEAVLSLEGRDGEAKESTLANVGCADGATLGFELAARQYAERFFLFAFFTMIVVMVFFFHFLLRAQGR